MLTLKGNLSENSLAHPQHVIIMIADHIMDIGLLAEIDQPGHYRLAFHQSIDEIAPPQVEDVAEQYQVAAVFEGT